MGNFSKPLVCGKIHWMNTEVNKHGRGIMPINCTNVEMSCVCVQLKFYVILTSIELQANVAYKVVHWCEHFWQSLCPSQISVICICQHKHCSTITQLSTIKKQNSSLWNCFYAMNFLQIKIQFSLPVRLSEFTVEILHAYLLN